MNKMTENASIIMTNENLTCVIANKTEVIYKSSERGINPLFNFINFSSGIGPFYLSDKIIGKAAALLCIKAGICEVQTIILSSPALQIFKDNSIIYKYDSLVPRIMNRTKSGLCPMEALSEGVESPEDMYLKIKKWLTSMKSS